MATTTRSASASASASGLNFVFLIILPPVYMLGAVVALLQFQVAFTLLLQACAKVKTVSALKFLAPFATGIPDHLIKIFGQPHKFVPQTTHVILVALIIAVIVHLERSRR